MHYQFAKQTDNKCQKLTTSKWQEVVERMTASDKASENQWKPMILVELNPEVQCVSQKLKTIYTKFTG